MTNNNHVFDMIIIGGVDCQLKIVQKLFSQRESLKLNRS